MNTPICDFVNKYCESSTSRFHMPGHKGSGIFGFEKMDITEIKGADELFEAEGIIAESEANASSLFGSASTLYSTEGSSLCIRTMLALATQFRSSENTCSVKKTNPRTILAARNVHRAFITACALLDLEVEWLWPEEETFSLCSCKISADQVRKKLAAMPELPAAIYLTSPDYLGGMQDIKEISNAAHEFGTILIVDNAHGAYLKFLPESAHPLDLGADMCCDSAHKTLPVLTGGAYLHISANAPAGLIENAKFAMATFASTSPSYLILQSLDYANKILADNFFADLSDTCRKLAAIRLELEEYGWQFWGDEAIKLTILSSECGWKGADLAEELRKQDIECEYADPDYLVLMISHYNSTSDLDKLRSALKGIKIKEKLDKCSLKLSPPETSCSIRNAHFAAAEVVSADSSVGRILASEGIGCPPAVSVLVSGEKISAEAAEILKYYNITEVRVRK